MKILKLILAFAMLFGAVATVGVAPATNEIRKVEADTTSVTLTKDDFSTASYAANANIKSIQGIGVSITDVMASGGIQFKKTSGLLYSTSALKAPITSIEFVMASGSLTVYSSSSTLSSKPSSNTGTFVNNV